MSMRSCPSSSCAPSRWAPSRLFAALLVGSLGAAAPVLTGCASPNRQPITQIGLNRETPKDAYEYLKAMVEASQVEAEWRSFSPGFKRRLSDQVGRNVDIGDYSHARATVASNARKELKLLLESEFVSQQMLSDSVALVTIRAKGRQATPRFVKMTTWELTLKGEGEPVAEFIPRAADVISISPKGDVAMRVTPSNGTASFLKDIPPDKIQRLLIQDEWYLDDFGGVEDAVVGGLRGDGSQGAPKGGSHGDGTGTGSPYRPPVHEPAPGSPDGGPGSPDAGPGSPDAGPGSPDAAPIPAR